MAIGIVLGVLIGTFVSVEAFFEPQIGFLRYIPASALTPLLLLWLGIGESPKITLIVVGTVFFNILMVADVVRLVPRELLNASATLGAGRWTTMPQGDPAALGARHHRRRPHQPRRGLADARRRRAARRAGGPGVPHRAGAAVPRLSTRCSPC